MKEKSDRKKKTRNIKYLLLIVAVLFAALISFSESINTSFIPTWQDIYQAFGLSPKTETRENLTVHYLDVGQSDSIFIMNGDHNILIDSGDNQSYKFVISYLNRYGVKKIDMLVATHLHADHIGGMDQVIKNYEIGTILMSELPDSLVPATKTYTDMLKEVEAKNYKLTKAKTGDIFRFGEAIFRVNNPDKQYSDINDFSVVLRLDYGKTSFLFSGDASAPAEEEMAKYPQFTNVDVLGVSHHGSNSASTANYLRLVSPLYAIISVGEGNSYGFPKKEVMTRLSQTGAKIYRTDQNGTILVKSDGINISVTTEKNPL